MTTQLMVVPELSIESFFDENGKLKLPPAEIERRDALISESTGITKLTTEADRDHAINTSARLKGLEKEMDEAHILAKHNFLRMCQAIDEAKRSFNNAIIPERERLNRLVGSFEQERRAAILKAQQELEAEKARLAAEARRLEEEAAKTTDFAKSVEADEKAIALHEKAEELDRQIVIASTSKAKGGSMREEIEIRVTDVKALFAAKPHLVRMEGDLTAIKYEIRHRLAEGETIPGVSFTKVAKFSANKR